MTRQARLMLVFGVLVVLVAIGMRQAFGVFLRPVTADLEIGRQAFGLVIAIQALLFGLAQPFTGMLADRFGAPRMVLAGSILYALGLWLAASVEGAPGLYLSLGLLVGIGLSGTTQVVVLGAVGRVVPNERRSVAFGTIIASGSLGMFLFVPGVQALIDSVGWRETFSWLAAMIVLLPLFALGLRSGKSDAGRVAAGGVGAGGAEAGGRQPIAAAIAEARGHRGYMLLTAGFFVCGFHVTFVGTHLPAYLVDNQVSPTAGAFALAIIGLFNVAGAYIFGALGDRFGKKNLLVAIYLGRALLMSALLILPVTDATAIAFGAIMGLLWLATVPLTSGIVAQVFGTRHFSMLYGVVFMSHQFGSFFGAWVGGVVYDATGSYDLMWMLAIALGLVSAALHWPITEQPLVRLSGKAA